jgi:hypothetical protein
MIFVSFALSTPCSTAEAENGAGATLASVVEVA